jgi:DNA ligase-1
MQTFPTLYKRDSKGKIREWRMEVDGNRYRTIAGLQDGQQVTSEWTTVSGKNVGRSNETTPEEQAISEVNSEYEKKLKVDYHEDINNVDEAKIYKPMLAKKWEDRHHKIDWDDEVVHVQPKLDGIRCIANRNGLWSRTGKPIVAVPHIAEALAKVFEQFPNAVFDGELYNHDLRDDFNAIVSMVRKAKPSSTDLTLAEEMVQFHIYDFPTDITEAFSDRLSRLIDVFLDHELQPGFTGVPGPTNDMLQIVETLNCPDKETVDLRYAEFLQQGYEGGIVRLDGPYEQKRSNMLLKRKDFEDDEFEIVAIEEGNGNWAGYAKVVVFRNPDGSLNRASIQGSRDYTRHVLENAEKYIGKQATIQYFNITPDGAPRFPVAKVLHEDKRW